MRHIHRLIIIAALVASSTWSWAQTRGAASPSPADIEKAKQRFHSAEAHKQKGDELRGRGDTAEARKAYSLAIKDYIAGYKLSRLRLFLYNLGSSYRLRGNQEWAIRCYQAFLDTRPHDERDVKDAFTFIAELAQDLASGAESADADPSIDPAGVCMRGAESAPLLEAKASGPDKWPDTWLEIVTDPPGAKVYIDGKDVGPSGRAYAVTAGKYTVRIELDGYDPAEKTVDAVAAQTTKLELTLSMHIDTPPGPRHFGAWKWALLGTGVGLTTAGVVNVMIDGPRVDDNGARLPEKYDSQIWGYTLVASGVIAMGVSGYFFYHDATLPRTAPSPDTSAPEHARNLTLQRLRDGWSLGLSGRF